MKRNWLLWGKAVIPVMISVPLICGIGAARDSKDYFFPDSLDAPGVVKTFLAEKTKPGFSFSDLASAKYVSAHALLFRARVDDRPLVLEECLLCAQVEIGGKQEWWLMLFYRNPYI